MTNLGLTVLDIRHYMVHLIATYATTVCTDFGGFSDLILINSVNNDKIPCSGLWFCFIIL